MEISEQKPLWRHLGYLVLWFTVLYGLLIVFCRVLVPPFQHEVIDTSKAWYTPYSTGQKLAYYGRDALIGPKNRIIFIGASNTQLGMSATKTGAAFQDYAVHNMSVVKANITVLRQLADIVVGRVGKEAVQGDIFVFGVWYGCFVSDEYRWNAKEGQVPRTLMDDEGLRFGFIGQTEKGFRRRVPDAYFGEIQLLIYPLIALDRIIRVATGTRTFPDEEYMNSVKLSEQVREQDVIVRREEMGDRPLSESQFQKLDDLIVELTSMNANVVVVNLAIPKWHKEVSPYYADYSVKISERMKGHADLPGFAFVDISDLDNEAWYFDGAHLRPNFHHKWLEKLVPTFKSFGAEVSPTYSNTEG